jgi:hypothetical protein
MRLQVHLVQNTPHSVRADRRYNALNHRFAGQILTAPVGNAQPLSSRFQTRLLHNLGTLQGGTLDRMPRARHLGQDTLQPRLFIAPTQPPNRGRITRHLKGHGLSACAFGDGQHHPCSLDLKPRQGATACNLFEDRLIVSGQ